MDIETLVQQQHEMLTQLIQMVAENNKKLSKLDSLEEKMDQRFVEMKQ